MDCTKAKNYWTSAWEEKTHTTERAKKRIELAKKPELTPIEIDTTNMRACFSGNHGKYTAFLDDCSCEDFRRNRLPCKHIYRLAIELGAMEEAAESNRSTIPFPRSEQVSLSDTIDLVEALPEKAQKRLLEIAGNTKPDLRFQLKYHGIDELLRSGLVIETKPESRQIIWPKKGEIAKLLEQEGIAYDPKAKKDELQRICWEHLSEKAKELFESWIVVDVSPNFNRRKIHYYLHRKFSFSLFFNPETANTEKTPLLKTNLPNDEVTDELIRRGYYTRK